MRFSEAALPDVPEDENEVSECLGCADSPAEPNISFSHFHVAERISLAIKHLRKIESQLKVGGRQAPAQELQEPLLQVLSVNTVAMHVLHVLPAHRWP